MNPSSEPRSPRDVWRAVAGQLGAVEAARRCAALVDAEDPEDVRDTLELIGAADRVLDGGTWQPYWVRSWGARGLLYVWTDECVPAVVRGLADPHWRPAEMCVKVSARRELGQAGPGIAALAGHELPRVRVVVARALGIVGDTEHVEVIRDLLDDPDSGVRVAAERALPRIADRLDIHPER